MRNGGEYSGGDGSGVRVGGLLAWLLFSHNLLTRRPRASILVWYAGHPYMAGPLLEGGGGGGGGNTIGIGEIANCVDLVSLRIKDGETIATPLTDKAVNFINCYSNWTFYISI